MKKLILACVLVLGWACHSEAQVTAEIVTIYRQGSATPATSPIVLDRAFRVCGQTITPAPTTAIVNPRRLEWTDPATPTTACVWTDPGTAFLSLLTPDANLLEATIRFRINGIDSPEGPRSNVFTRLPTPGQLRVGQ